MREDRRGEGAGCDLAGGPVAAVPEGRGEGAGSQAWTSAWL
ncbi:hypothetical protein ACUXZZ_00370 [Streptomyces graminifolii]